MAQLLVKCMDQSFQNLTSVQLMCDECDLLSVLALMPLFLHDTDAGAQTPRPSCLDYNGLDPGFVGCTHLSVSSVEKKMPSKKMMIQFCFKE